MSVTTNRRFNIIGGILMVVLLAAAGGALYMRMANAGGDDFYTSENYNELEDLARQVGDGNSTPQGEAHASTLTLAGTILESEIYHFSGNMVSVSMTTYVTGGEGAIDYFTIELHRIEAGVIDVLVGSQTCNRSGYVNVSWTDVPEGDYYFVFKKDADSQVINSDYVIMGSFVTIADLHKPAGQIL